VRIARDEVEPQLIAARGLRVNHALLGIDQRRHSDRISLDACDQVAVALQHAREIRPGWSEPVLLGSRSVVSFRLRIISLNVSLQGRHFLPAPGP